MDILTHLEDMHLSELAIVSFLKRWFIDSNWSFDLYDLQAIMVAIKPSFLTEQMSVLRSTWKGNHVFHLAALIVFSQ